MTNDFCDEALSGCTPVSVERETGDVLPFHHTRPYWPVHIVVGSSGALANESRWSRHVDADRFHFWLTAARDQTVSSITVGLASSTRLRMRTCARTIEQMWRTNTPGRQPAWTRNPPSRVRNRRCNRDYSESVFETMRDRQAQERDRRTRLVHQPQTHVTEVVVRAECDGVVPVDEVSRVRAVLARADVADKLLQGQLHDRVAKVPNREPNRLPRRQASIQLRTVVRAMNCQGRRSDPGPV